MANEEHLKLLKEAIQKKDITMWNGWRLNNPHFRPDLSGAVLRGANLKQARFWRADLQWVSRTCPGIPHLHRYYGVIRSLPALHQRSPVALDRQLPRRRMLIRSLDGASVPAKTRSFAVR